LLWILSLSSWQEKRITYIEAKSNRRFLIAGDIPQIVREYIDKDKFYEKFKISDKMEGMLKNIPIYLVKQNHTALKGAALYSLLSRIKQTPKKFGVFYG
jgi:hypothetical protein